MFNKKRKEREHAELRLANSPLKVNKKLHLDTSIVCQVEERMKKAEQFILEENFNATTKP